MLTGIALVHENNIIHCDVKPQNFLLFTEDMLINSNNKENINDLDLSIDSYEDITEHTSILKLADFGLCHVIPKGEKVAFAKYSCGTHIYKAPELTNVCLAINY
jgi:serine/threonine protein kinase